jgi:hypothetical protein
MPAGRGGGRTGAGPARHCACAVRMGQYSRHTSPGVITKGLREGLPRTCEAIPDDANVARQIVVATVMRQYRRSWASLSAWPQPPSATRPCRNAAMWHGRPRGRPREQASRRGRRLTVLAHSIGSRCIRHRRIAPTQFLEAAVQGIGVCVPFAGMAYARLRYAPAPVGNSARHARRYQSRRVADSIGACLVTAPPPGRGATASERNRASYANVALRKGFAEALRLRDLHRPRAQALRARSR